MKKYLITMTDMRTGEQYKWLSYKDMSNIKIIHEYGDSNSEVLFRVTFEEVSE